MSDHDDETADERADDTAGGRYDDPAADPNDDATAEPRTGADHLCEALAAAGVDLVVGVPGTQTIPFDEAIDRQPDLRYVMARHETAIPHVAWGYAEAGGGTAATVTVPGPGDANAIHGLKNAAEDGVPIVHVSADVDPGDRGKSPIHEIDPATYDHAVKANVQVQRRRDLPAAVARAVAVAHEPPTGPVRLGVPGGFLAADLDAPPATYEPARTTHDLEPEVERAADLLADASRPLVYVGGGVRRSPGGPTAIQDLTDALSAPVVASFKGKGAFPGTDDRFLGVAGPQLPAGAREVAAAADVAIAVGADLDGVTTEGWSLPLGDRLIHVTLDPVDLDAGYEADVGLVADAAAAVRSLLAALDGEPADRWDGTAVGRRVGREYEEHLADAGLLDREAPATTPATLRAVREAIPREATVTTDGGGARLWALQVFDSDAPERFVTAGSWAGMGVGVPAAVGAALAREEPAVALVGDGGLLMCLQSLHTAVAAGLDLVVVVLNNADYAAISAQVPPREDGRGRFAWESPSFETVASGLGCEAATVETAEEAAAAVDRALDAGGVTRIDVRQPDEATAGEIADYETSVEFPSLPLDEEDAAQHEQAADDRGER
jgi:acetolactate synthase-1/2/3 large subunit